MIKCSNHQCICQMLGQKSTCECSTACKYQKGAGVENRNKRKRGKSGAVQQ